MAYVDAMFDRDQDIIRCVERKDGKRHFTEYNAKYTFYYEDAKGIEPGVSQPMFA